MSADAEPSTPDNDDPAWRPSESLDRDPGEAVSGIQSGFRKFVEGGTEAASSAILLLILLILNVLDKEDDSEEMTPEEKAAEWDAHTDPIQKRFEENDVDEEEVVEDAIAWARSQE